MQAWVPDETGSFSLPTAALAHCRRMSIAASLVFAAAATLPVAMNDAPDLAAEETPASASEPVACVAGQVIVPPFNNSPAAMDQSRVAATIVMRGKAGAGGKPIRVCQTSAVSPELSRLKHRNEVPVDPDYEGEDKTPPSSE